MMFHGSVRLVPSVWFALTVLLSSATYGQDVTCEKYQLDNGLTVILHEDHTLPVACVNMWYYVASKDEPDGRSGFAHLFEHLMFMGTNRVPGSDFDNIMEAGGGYNNASTSEDRTNYFEMGPAELLPTLLWLEADRLEDLGKAMTQEKLDKQRDVVRNERRQSYENRPYGKADLRVHGLMFPEDHPYHKTVIGSHEDLAAATVDDVKKFFSTYYIPSNAGLVVAGDFDPAEIKPLIAGLFGTLPRGSDVVHAQAGPVKLSTVKRVTNTDKVQFARTTMVYHSPPFYAPGDAAMDLAAAVLSDGISSRLYQKLVYENELAVDVSAYQASMLLGSLFYVQATARSGVELDTIEQAIDEVLAEFTQGGPTQEELERRKSKIEYSMVSRLQSILGKADALNRYQFYYGEPNSFARDLQRYRDATPDHVRDWARKVLTPDARLILRVIPEIEVPDTTARDERPDDGDAAAFAPLLPETFKLSNGITVHHWPRRELPLVALTMLFPAGASGDPTAKAGLSALTADMLDEGAAQRNAVEFADALDLLGASVAAHSSREYSTVDLSVLTRNFEPALALWADAVLRPRFEQKEWDRVHKLHIQRLARALDRPTYVAQTVAMRAFFGDEHPYSRPIAGHGPTAEAVTLEDVKEFHKKLARPTGAVILVAGDLTADELRTHLESTLGGWTDPADVGPPVTPSYPAPVNDALRVVVVDRPDAVQTVIRFVMPGPVYADPNRPKLQLFNTILGGSFTSRLNQNLREEHGYTYGARSGFSMNTSVGYFSASSNVRADQTGAALGEFLKEFAAIRAGDINAQEARKARTSRRMAMIQSFAGLQGILNAATTLVRNNRPFTAMGDELAEVARVTEAELNHLANDAVPLERALLILVGDKKLILKQLTGLDLPEPTVFTVTGDPASD
ncbi:MAG: insulinase family protein [Planctomycetes bacterium]|nr:insulinase family protein [Planctomycetota bacterium]